MARRATSEAEHGRERQHDQQQQHQAADDPREDQGQHAVEVVLLLRRLAQREEVRVDLARDPEGQLGDARLVARARVAARAGDDGRGRLVRPRLHLGGLRPLVDDPVALEDARAQQVGNVGQLRRRA